MKIRFMSDLHLEFGPLELEPAGEDVLLLAGDIGLHTDGIQWADTQAQRLGVPVVMIAGNHEFYRGPHHYDHTFEGTLDDLYEAAARTGGAVTYLENDSVSLNGGFIVGATLWTDFDLDGNAPLTMIAAQRGMNDYALIKTRGEFGARNITPLEVLRRHAVSRSYIESHLPICPGPTIVMTHHAPTGHSIAPDYVDNILNPAYASNLEALIIEHRPTLWVHGHMHRSFDYKVGITRVASNPRGYCRYDLNPLFNPNLIVEV